MTDLLKSQTSLNELQQEKALLTREVERLKSTADARFAGVTLSASG